MNKNGDIIEWYNEAGGAQKSTLAGTDRIVVQTLGTLVPWRTDGRGQHQGSGIVRNPPSLFPVYITAVYR